MRVRETSGLRGLVLRVTLPLLAVVIAAPWASAQGTPSKTSVARVFETQQGQGVVTLDLDAVGTTGLTLSDQTGRFYGESGTGFVVRLRDDSALEIAPVDRSLGVFIGGSTTLDMILEFSTEDGRTHVVRNPELISVDGANGTVWSVVSKGDEIFELISSSLVEMDQANGRMRWEDVEVILGADVVEALGMPDAAGMPIGTLALEAQIAITGHRVGEEAISGHPVTDGGIARLGGIGPDVIVGSLPDIRNWGAVGGIQAYSVATTSCNIGDANLDWIENSNRHPVIGQNLYRLKNGRLEMIGLSWLKHGFFALSGSLCFNDCQGTDGTELGVHCSDPYGASLNGSRSGLGPKSQVNAATGGFIWPPTQPPSNATIGRRLQVAQSDVNPAQNPGALYFVEGHYITPDDSAAGNDENNASYRRVTVSSGSLNLNGAGPTVQQQPAIMAWKANDASVQMNFIDLPQDGRFYVGSKATDLGGGTWNYEFAVHNLNSHRSGQAFSVRFPPGSNISNIGFHDVDYHSGEPYSGADWTSSVGIDSITWSTQTIGQNQNANALRWGTLYNFRFDCDCPPHIGEATITTFRTAGQNDFPVVAEAPMVDPPEAAPDLAVSFIFVDYDPSTGPINNGPGGIGQEVDVLVRVRNTGNVPLSSASVSVETSVVGGTTLNKNIVVTDFSSDPGVQSLPTNTNFDVIFSYAAGELDRCGTYTLIASHDGSALVGETMGGPVVGDQNATNDFRRDYPADQNNPNDDQTPDLLELRFGTIFATVEAASVVIENKATEKLRIRVNYNGLGPGGDSHDVELTADLMDPTGSTLLHTAVFTRAKMNVRSSGSKLVTFPITVSTVPAGEYRVLLTLRDTNSTESCIIELTGNTTTIQ